MGFERYSALSTLQWTIISSLMMEKVRLNVGRKYCFSQKVIVVHVKGEEKEDPLNAKR